MISIIDAYHIASLYIFRQLKSWALWLFFLMGVVFTLALHWNSEASTLEFAGLNLEIGGLNGRLWAFKYAFYDLFFAGWIAFVFFIFSRVLMPITASYTVSQSLWLRLSSANHTTLAIARVFQVLSATSLILLGGLMWVLFYSVYHQIKFHELVACVYGTLGYVLLAGGIIVLISGRPTTGMDRRYAFVVVSMSTPILLYLIGKNGDIIRRFDGYFPFALPLSLKNTTFEAVRAYKTAGMLGASLLVVSLLKSFYVSFLKHWP